jgi:methanesulfonate monooxygenase subunit beta
VQNRHQIEELIYKSCMLLDARDFSGYLGLCDDAFHYTVSAYSPEIRKDMVWLDHDKAGMKLLFDNLPKHNSDHSPLHRHATVYTVELDSGQSQAQVVSALQIYRTSLDGGATELFAVGKYHDTVKVNGADPKLLVRKLRMDTRMFGFGYHIPF